MQCSSYHQGEYHQGESPHPEAMPPVKVAYAAKSDLVLAL
jgi:hypothetical protein